VYNKELNIIINLLFKIIFIHFISFTFPLICYQEPLSTITNAQEFKDLYPFFSEYFLFPNNEVARFFVIRHGESEANLNRFIDSRILNLPLTHRGLQEAQDVGQLLAKKIDKVDIIVSSPLIRAVQTAEEINKIFEKNCFVVLDSRLIERDYGIFDGCSTAEFELCKKAEVEMIPLLKTFLEKLNYREHPSMENYQETYNRMSSVLFELAENHLGENIVITTHGNSMRSLFMMGNAEKHNVFVPNYLFKTLNGCILFIESNGKTMKIQAFEGMEFLDKK
jgi:broad specificity phosphatase PhoE